jgi:alpha-beta hydrolase superfamily lysophospholipase
MFKFTTALLLTSLLGGLLLAPMGCQPNTDDPTAPAQPLVLTRSEQLATLTTDQLRARYTGGFAAFQLFIRSGVSVHRLTYTTTNTDGKSIQASGLVIIPTVTTALPLLSMQHGTITSDTDAPSYYGNSSEVTLFGSVLSSQGYIISAPDYIGYGASNALPHPYQHRASLATASLDMLRATREFLTQRNTNWDKRLFITGYSEGGFAGMALLKKMEEEVPTEFNLIAASLGAGAYDTPAFMRNVVNTPTSAAAGASSLYLWVLQTYAQIYTPARPFSYYVKEPYATQLASRPGFQVSVPGSIDVAFTDSFKQAVTNKSDALFERAVADNDIHDWKPKTPLQLYHGDADNTVFYFNSVNTVNAMKARGAARVELIPIPGGTHATSIPNYVLGTNTFFGSFQ